jgi:hypothetical protein
LDPKVDTALSNLHGCKSIWRKPVGYNKLRALEEQSMASKTLSTAASTAIQSNQTKRLNEGGRIAPKKYSLLNDRQLEVLLRRQFKIHAEWITRDAVQGRRTVKFDAVDKNIKGSKFVLP